MERARNDWVRGIHPHGLWCGLLMSVWVYWMRHADAPVPLIEVVVVVPCSASGFWSLGATLGAVGAALARFIWPPPS